MSESKTLLYRLAELMLEAGSNELSVDPLFDDPEIGDWVKSIQIDSPYQQMLLQGVLTESVKENELKVRFTFEGYFSTLLGYIFFEKYMYEEPRFFEKLIYEKKYINIQESVNKYLILEAQKDNYSRIFEFFEFIDKYYWVLQDAIFIFLSFHEYEKDGDKERIGFRLGLFFDNILSCNSKQVSGFIKAFLGYLKRNDRLDIIEKLSNHFFLNYEFYNSRSLLISILLIKYVDSGKKIEILDLYEKFNLSGDKSTIAYFYKELGREFLDLGEFDKSRKYLEFSKQIYENELQENYIDEVALINVFMAKISYREKKNEEAINFISKSLSLKELNRLKKSNNYFNQIGSLHFLKKEYAKALEFFGKDSELKLNKFGNYSKEIIINYNNLAVLSKLIGDLDASIYYLEKSREIWKRIYGVRKFRISGDQEKYSIIAKKSQTKAQYLKGNGVIKKSLFFYKKALIYFMYLDNVPKISIMLFRIGECYQLLGEYLHSIQYFHKVYLFEKKGSILFKIASIYKDMGDTDTAFSFYLESATLRKERVGVDAHETLQSVMECIRLSKDLNRFSELPGWIKDLKI